MKARTGVDSAMDGPAQYRFLLTDALLSAKDHLLSEDFGTFIEWAMSVGADLFSEASNNPESAEKEWRQRVAALMVDDRGQPLPEGAEIPRPVRFRMVREVIRLARTQGVYGILQKPFSDGSKVFKGVLHDGTDSEDDET